MQPGLLAMRVRLSDAATSAVLAEHYRMQATACQQMALISVSIGDAQGLDRALAPMTRNGYRGGGFDWRPF
jgi:hypothetical protein